MCQYIVGTRLSQLFQRFCDYYPSVKHNAIPWEHFVTDSRFFVVWVYRIPISNKVFPHYINSIQNKLVVEIYGQALMSRVKFWYKNKTVWNNTKTFIYFMRLVETYCFPLECILPLFFFFRWLFDINHWWLFGSLAESHSHGQNAYILIHNIHHLLYAFLSFFISFYSHFHVAHSFLIST